jgi:hypothetical protein
MEECTKRAQKSFWKARSSWELPAVFRSEAGCSGHAAGGWGPHAIIGLRLISLSLVKTKH